MTMTRYRAHVWRIDVQPKDGDPFACYITTREKQSDQALAQAAEIVCQRSQDADVVEVRVVHVAEAEGEATTVKADGGARG